MDVRGCLDDMRAGGRGDRVVHVRGIPARPLAAPVRRLLEARGIAQLRAHRPQ